MIDRSSAKLTVKFRKENAIEDSSFFHIVHVLPDDISLSLKRCRSFPIDIFYSLSYKKNFDANK